MRTEVLRSFKHTDECSPNLSRGGISRRASGAIQLQAADFMAPNRESMSDLWINFLQTEAAMNAADTADAQ